MACTRLLVAPSIRPFGCSGSPISQSVTCRGLRTKVSQNTVANSNRMRVIESMPFQTYQLALEVIRKDRQEKLAEIKEQRKRMTHLAKLQGVVTSSRQMLSMQRRLEWLKIQADINSPRVKYNFDQGISASHYEKAVGKTIC